jgi:hypothetical protein
MKRSCRTLGRLGALGLSGALAAAAVGCATDETANRPRPDGGGDGTVDVPDGGGCEWSVGADPIAVSPAPAPTTFETVTTAVQNLYASEFASPVPPPRMGALRAGPCGTIALAYRRDAGGSPALAYLPLGDATGPSVGTPETVDDTAGDPGLDLSLFFDDDCEPLVMRLFGGNWIEYRREGPGWSAVSTELDPVALTGSRTVSALSGSVGRDGRFHLFGRGGAFLIHGSRSSAAGGTWTWEARPYPPATDLYALAVDSAGTIHAAYRATEYPCDPCDVTSFHARLASGAAEWTTSVLQAGIWGPPLDEYVDEAALAIDADDRPLVAGHFVRRVETGSHQSAELRLYAAGAGSDCRETAATANDGYAGNDGTRFTGAAPFATVDGDGRVHVLFLDQAIWHDGNGWENEVRGQWRHAVRTRAGWSLTRLFDQPGRTESASPLVGALSLQGVVTPDGGHLAAVAVEWTWETDSIYNDGEMPMTLRAQVLSATLTPR